ncbi:MAG: immunoglobulin domain-containing protein, partial [Verrucomicrobia bacterium]|nr:immunoglobulin domain-containing protein [Verrucomicrobiota bacterium]
MKLLRAFFETGRLQQAALLAFACILTMPLAAIASPASGGGALGRARFSWDVVDDPVVSGYKVYWGTASRVYTHTVDAGNVTEVIIAEFSEGIEYFAAVTAYSSTGEESDYSTELSFVYDTTSISIVFTSQPQAQVVTVGQAATFSVTATGSGTLTYQWQKGGVTINGATSSTYSIGSPVVTDAGNYTVVVANAGGNTTSDAAMLTVNPATPVITQAPVAAAITYGQPLADATLSGGAAAVPGTFAFTSPTTVPNAGTANQAVMFTPTDTANYTPVSIQVSVTVNRATPVITKAPVAAAITYGQPLSAAILSSGTASVPGTFAFASPTTVPTAGTVNQAVVFTPTDTANYQTVSVQVSVTVNPATPVITETPVAAAITYGQPLSAAILSGGTASVPGTFAFASSTTVPIAGTTNQAVTFTPTDTANNNTVSVQVSVTVNPATPVITIPPVAAAIIYGLPLADATLSGGTASVPGMFAFASPTTVPNAGTANQAVMFTPTDTANYQTVSVQVSVTVNRATPVITKAPVAAAIIYGQPLSAATLSGGTASVPGRFA